MNSFLTRKNMNLAVGRFSLFVMLWIVMYAVPGLFVRLFDTNLGNMMLAVFIFLAGMYSIKLAVGLLAVFVILWRFQHMRLEQFML
jgi:hypothetical protein